MRTVAVEEFDTVALTHKIAVRGNQCPGRFYAGVAFGTFIYFGFQEIISCGITEVESKIVAEIGQPYEGCVCQARVTNTRWNGLVFFGIRRQGAA
jgi:hypothetical protein